MNRTSYEVPHYKDIEHTTNCTNITLKIFEWICFQTAAK